MAFTRKNNNGGKQMEYQSLIDSKYNSVEEGCESDAKLSLFFFGQKLGIKINPPLPEEQQTDYRKYDNDVEVTASIYLTSIETMTFIKNARLLMNESKIEIPGAKKTKSITPKNCYIDNSKGDATMILHKISEDEYSLEIREYSQKNPDKIVKSLFYDFDVTPINAGFNIGEDDRKGKSFLPAKADVENFLAQLEMATTVGSQLHQTQKTIMYYIGRISDIIEIINGKMDSLFNGRSAGVGRGGNSKEKSYSRNSGNTESRYSRQRGSSNKRGRNDVDEEDADLDDIEDTMED